MTLTTTRKRSFALITIVIGLMFLIGCSSFYIIYLTHTIKADAEITNKLGLIRGSIQRLIKLELTGSPNEQLVADIDQRIKEFYEQKIKVYDGEGVILSALETLRTSWIPLKETIYIYRANPTNQNKIILIENSEKIWEKSNTMVMASQLASQSKVSKYQISLIFLGINLILGLLLILFIKNYVQDTLEYLVNYDGLTGIYNRRYFTGYLENELKKAARYSRNLALIMFDIDHFKRVNDRLGHDAGDSVLKELSDLIRVNLRKCDMLSRIGGEEFAIVAAETSLQDGLHLAEKLRKIVEENEFKHAGKITISLGVTQFVPGDNSELLFKKADTALYKAKAEGRNRSEAA